MNRINLTVKLLGNPVYSELPNGRKIASARTIARTGRGERFIIPIVAKGAKADLLSKLKKADVALVDGELAYFVKQDKNDETKKREQFEIRVNELRKIEPLAKEAKETSSKKK